MEQIINIEIKRDISNLENADKSFIEEISLATEKDVKKTIKKSYCSCSKRFKN